LPCAQASHMRPYDGADVMLSQSAAATRAEEARFRIDAPNSKPRAIKVIALDRLSEPIVKRVARLEWNGAVFFTASAFSMVPQGEQHFSIEGWLKDLSGRTRDLINEVNDADLVVMVATAGEEEHAVSIIGEACSLKRVMTTAVVLSDAAAPDEAL